MGYLGEEERRLRAESSAIAHIIAKVQSEHGLAGTMQVVLRSLLQLFEASRAVVAVKENRSGRTFLWETSTASDSLGAEPKASEISPEQRKSGSSQSHAIVCRQRDAVRRLRSPNHSNGQHGKEDKKWLLPISLRFLSIPGESLRAYGVGQLRGGVVGTAIPVQDSCGISRRLELRFLQALVQAASPPVYSIYLSERLRARAGSMERARLGRELHDGVIQVLTGLQLQLEAVRQSPRAPQRMVEEVSRIQNLLRQEDANLRELMQRATPCQPYFQPAG